jgi:putative ABC transport system substrate-binding protein
MVAGESTMKRREFITLLGGAAGSGFLWPPAAHAQQAKLPVIGFIIDGTVDASRDILADFRRGLAETGYVEGRNVAIDYRASDGQNDNLPVLAADLVRRRVTVISGMGSTVAVRAAKAATTTIPIVFWIGGDPVKLGLVASFNRPGGNVTGVSAMTNELGPKRLGLLRALLPNAARIAALVNPSNPNAEADVNDLVAAGRSLGVTIDVLSASNEHDIDRFFATLVQRQASAFITTADPLWFARREQIIGLAADHAIPAMYHNRLLTDAGGLMSYASDAADVVRQAGVYTGQVLKGTKPVDLPIVRPTKFELVINAKTAKALGLTLPTTLLALADEVIE